MAFTYSVFNASTGSFEACQDPIKELKTTRTFDEVANDVAESLIQMENPNWAPVDPEDRLDESFWLELDKTNAELPCNYSKFLEAASDEERETSGCRDPHDHQRETLKKAKHMYRQSQFGKRWQARQQQARLDKFKADIGITSSPGTIIQPTLKRNSELLDASTLLTNLRSEQTEQDTYKV